MSNIQNQNIIEGLQERIDNLKEALRCYSLNFPCPGFEVGIDAGITSGCSGIGTDCPICQILKNEMVNK